MSRAPDIPPEAAAAAGTITAVLGEPRMGVILGSGFADLSGAVESSATIETRDVPGYPESRTEGHGGTIRAARVGETPCWLFDGRLHLYEGRSAEEVVRPVAVLAAAGARGVLLTCAAGGLAHADRAGDFALITDHLNLTGEDPVRAIRPQDRRTPFVDLHGVYDDRLLETWRAAARGEGPDLRDGVLAAVAGPSYETPAEVRMLRTAGANLVSMSTVPEALAAHYYGMRVAAIACVANRGAGMDTGEPIRHDDVLAGVRAAVARGRGFLIRGLEAMARELVASGE
jgi:purine-nucleoside phosphorylase